MCHMKKALEIEIKNPLDYNQHFKFIFHDKLLKFQVFWFNLI